MYRYVFLLIAISCLFFGCNSKSSTRDSSTENNRKEKKTFYGKQVQRAKDLSRDVDRRNDLVKKQADELFSDNYTGRE